MRGGVAITLAAVRASTQAPAATIMERWYLEWDLPAKVAQRRYWGLLSYGGLTTMNY